MFRSWRLSDFILKIFSISSYSDMKPAWRHDLIEMSWTVCKFRSCPFDTKYDGANEKPFGALASIARWCSGIHLRHLAFTHLGEEFAPIAVDEHGCKWGSECDCDRSNDNCY